MKYGVCNDYVNTKKMLQLEGYDVLHLFTDTRDDWGDDGGYLIAISKKNNLFYLQIVEINYNGVVDSHVLDEKMLEDKGGVADFIVFKTLDEVKKFLNEFVRVLDILVELNEADLEGEEFYGEDPEEFESWLNDNWGDLNFSDLLIGSQEELSFMLAEFMFKCFFPYSEYQKKDSMGILSMTNKPYVFIDEDEDDEDEY